MVEKKRRIIKKLPETLQNSQLTKFFNATVDHLFQPEASEKIAGFIGQVPAFNDTTKDFYIVEPTAERAFYQLEPAMITRDSLEEIAESLVYPDLINKLDFQAANVINHSRLFEQKYYSWSPPVNIDKLVNFTEYFWFPAGPTVISLQSSVSVPIDIPNDIIGQKNYTSATNITFTNGMKVQFSGTGLILGTGAAAFLANHEYIVEGVGLSILLVDIDLLDSTVTPLEQTVLDTEYITMDRGAVDENPWSRTNHWYHRDVLTFQDQGNNIVEVTAIPWDTTAWDSTVWDAGTAELLPGFQLDTSKQAKRPIIEFNRDLELFNSGTTLRPDVDLVDAINTNGYDDLNGAAMTSSTPFRTTTYTVDGILPTSGDRVLITTDTTTPARNAQIYVVGEFDTGGGVFEVVLTLATDGIAGDGSPTVNERVQIIQGITNTAKYYWYNGTGWVIAQRKLISNQAPLFNLYNDNKDYLGDELIFPNNNFNGDEIFNYKIGTIGAIDTELGFIVTHKNFVQVAEIIFESSIEKSTYSLNVDLEGEKKIVGFYYARHLNANGLPEAYLNGWYKFSSLSSQQVIDSLYTIPSNLQANPDSEEVLEITRSEFLKHFVSIVDGQLVTPYRNSAKDPSVGIEILQHQAPLLKTMLLAAEPTFDVMTAIRFAEREYRRFRNKLIQKTKTFEDNGINETLPKRDWLDDIILLFNVTKESAPGKFTFAFARVIASGKNFTDDTFTATAGQTIFTGTNAVSLDDETKQDILYVYVNDVLQLTDIDYTIVGNVVTLTTPATLNDIIILRYYANIIDTQSFIPATGAVLGITPIYTPRIFVDDTYATPTVIIQGHDGSTHILFGTWNAITGFSEARDEIIWEFEKRVYNTIRRKFVGDKTIFFNHADVSPGAFRSIGYTVAEFNDIITPIFSRWTIINQLNWQENTTHDAGNYKTWNWTGTTFTLPLGEAFGSYRAIYYHVFDTDRPHSHPWEMLGFAQEPSWWVTEYGGPPYTSLNTAMWVDLEAGNIENGPRAGIDLRYARPGLQTMLPVDSVGTLLAPDVANVIVSPPTTLQAQVNWKIGDRSPTETAWYRSENASFIKSQIGYLMKPAQFIELNWDTEDIVLGVADTTQIISQTTLDRRPHSELFVHGETIDVGLSTEAVIFRAGIQQWITNVLQSTSKDIKLNFGDKIRALEVILGWKGAGFLKGSNLRFTVDTFSPTSTQLTDKTFLQSDDFDLILYTSPPTKESFYGGVLIEWDGTNYVVFGYDVLEPTFTIIPSDTDGRSVAITVADITVLEFRDALDTTEEIGYGTAFDSRQGVYDFLISYQRHLETQGFVFDRYDQLTNELTNWRLAGKEYLFWSQDALATGSFISLSPIADLVKFQQKQGFIENVEEIISGTYSLLDREGFPIRPSNVETVRADAEMQIIPQNDQGIFGLRLNVKELEHAIFIQNITRFKDTIYIPLLNLRQPRLFVTGKRTTSWTGRLDAPGFIVDNITAKDIVPNFEKTAEDFRNYHSIENPSENDAITDTARHLIGYERRDYLENLVVDRDVQYEFYQGFIHQKGSPNAFTKLLRNNTISDADTVTFFEEWGIRIGEYGGLDIQPPIEVLLKRNEIKSDPQVLILSKGLIGDSKTDNLINILPNDERFILRPEDDDDRNFDTRPLNVVNPNDLANAGFLKLGDTDFIHVSIDALFDSTEDIFSAALLKTVWIAKDDNNSWNVRVLRDTGATVRTSPDISDPEQTVITSTNGIIIDSIITEKDIIVIRNVLGTDISVDNTHRIISNSLLSTTFNIALKTETASTTDGTLYYWDEIRFPNIDLQTATNFAAGEVIYFDDDTAGTGWKIARLNEAINDWDIFRKEEALIDPKKLKNSVIYDKRINQILTTLTLFDPFKGVIPGIADAEIAFKLEQDPANYTNGPELETFDPDFAWGNNQVDRIWWDLSAARYLWYEQGDIGYRYNNWGKLFPGTSIDVYEWVRSPVIPDAWENFILESRKEKDFEPSGTVKDVDTANGLRWVEREEFDQNSGLLKTFYYFWVKDKDSVPLADFRNIPSIEISKIISDPTGENIPWFAGIRTDSVLLANFQKSLSNDDSVLQINFKKTTSELPIHRQFDLIRENDTRSTIKDRNWNKMRDSLVGFDDLDKEIPDPNLNVTSGLGNFYRPRQTWFTSRVTAREIFIIKLNAFLTTIAVVDDVTGFDKNIDNAEVITFTDTVITSTVNNPVITIGDQMTVNSDIITFTGTTAISATNDINAQQTGDIVAELLITGLNDTIQLTSPGGFTIFLNNVLRTPVQDIGFTPTFVIGDAPKITVATRAIRDVTVVAPNEKVLVTADEELRGLSTLWRFTGLSGNDTWKLLKVQSFRTADFWDFIDWFAAGFDSSILSNIDRTVADLATRNALTDVVPGEIVKVENDGSGKFAIFELQSDGTWLTIVEEDRTIEFLDTLYDLANNSIGFDNQLFDVGLFDDVPNQEFREIMNGLRLDILVGTNLIQQNLLFFSMINYVHTEQSMVDWIFKSSYISIQTEGEKISQSTSFTEDKFESFFGYVQEIKPYHTKIRDFARKFTVPLDTVNAEVTDFDKPVFNDNGTLRVLDVDDIDDFVFMKNTKPWKDWAAEYEKGQTSDVVRANNVRKITTSIKLDRITCIKGDYVKKSLKINYEGDNTSLAFTIPVSNNIASVVVRFRGPQSGVAKSNTLVTPTDYTLSTDELTLTLIDAGQPWIAGTGGLSTNYVLSINFVEALESSPFQPSTATFITSRDNYVRKLFVNAQAVLTSSAEIFPFRPVNQKITVTVTGIVNGSQIILEIADKEDFSGTITVLNTYTVDTIENFDYFDDDFHAQPWFRARITPYGTGDSINVTVTALYDNHVSRILQHYKPVDGQIAATELLNCMYRGTVVDGFQLAFEAGWDSQPWDITGWDSDPDDLLNFLDVNLTGVSVAAYPGDDSTDVYALPPSSTAPNFVVYIYTQSTGLLTLLTDPGEFSIVGSNVDLTGGQAWSGTGDNLAAGFTLIIWDVDYVDNLLSTDIITEGNTFLQPQWEGDPEELLNLIVKENMLMTVVTSGRVRNTLLDQVIVIRVGPSIEFDFLPVTIIAGGIVAGDIIDIEGSNTGLFTGEETTVHTFTADGSIIVPDLTASRKAFTFYRGNVTAIAGGGVLTVVIEALYSPTINLTILVGDGTNGPFALGGTVLATDDIFVVQTGVLLTLTTDYTIAINPTNTITFVVAPAVGIITELVVVDTTHTGTVTNPTTEIQVGGANFTLTVTPAPTQPTASSIFVFVEGRRLRPAEASYYRADGNQTEFGVLNNENGLTAANVTVWADDVVQVGSGTDYDYVAGVGTLPDIISFVTAPQEHSRIAIQLLRNDEYRMNGATVEFSTASNSPTIGGAEEVKVIYFTTTDLPALTQTKSFAGHSDADPDGKFQYEIDQIVSNPVSGHWISVNVSGGTEGGERLLVTTDFTIVNGAGHDTTGWDNGIGGFDFHDGAVIKLETGLTTADEVVITVFQGNPRLDTIVFREFLGYEEEIHKTFRDLYREFIRVSTNFTTTLAVPYDADIDTTITVAVGDGSKFAIDGGIIWVGVSRIEYLNRVGDVLQQLIKGTKGSALGGFFAIGTTVHVGDLFQVVPTILVQSGAHETIWNDPGIRLQLSTGIEATFLRVEPGTYKGFS